MTVLAAPLGAQPETIPGEVVAVPILAPGAIAIDGDLGDWVSLPLVETVDGPQPSANPDVSGRLRWQIVAVEEQILVAATITDDQIIAGQNGENYWMEDSVEIYFNFADLAATDYSDGISQLRVSPIDLDNTDPDSLTITGVRADSVDVAGFVFPTTDGWGFEVSLDVPDASTIINGGAFGFQIQANGSSGEGRDLKLNWSSRDVNDTSFEDPSVFGQGVYLGDPGEDGVTGLVDSPDGESFDQSVPEVIVGEDAVVDDPTTTFVDESVPEEDNAGQFLFIAAIISAISILIGGVWFERRRKKSEEDEERAFFAGSMGELPEGEQR